MKQLDKKQLIESILNCLWSTDSPGDEKIGDLSESELILMRDGWLVHVGKEEAKEFRSALGQIMHYDTLTIAYSDKVLRGRFESFLIRLMTEHESRPDYQVIKSEVNSWLDNLISADNIDITYSALIENFVLKDEIIIGRVKFTPLNQETVTSVKNSYYMQIDKNQHSTEDEKESTKQRLVSDFSILESSKFASLASISIPSKDADKGLEVALEYIRETVDVLRFLGAIEKRSHPKDTIALQGESSIKEKSFFAVSDTGLWGIYYRDMPHPFQLDHKQLTYFEKFGSLSLFEILGKGYEQRSELENRLINAIHWISEAIREISEQTRFLKLCISLESMLCGRDEEAFGTTIGERLAFLLENNSEKRKLMFRKTKSIYSIRSKIAHEGKPEKVETLTELMPYALAYSIRVIVKINQLVKEFQWKDFNNFRQYVEDLKFDGHEKN